MLTPTRVQRSATGLGAQGGTRVGKRDKARKVEEMSFEVGSLTLADGAYVFCQSMLTSIVILSLLACYHTGTRGHMGTQSACTRGPVSSSRLALVPSIELGADAPLPLSSLSIPALPNVPIISRTRTSPSTLDRSIFPPLPPTSPPDVHRLKLLEAQSALEHRMSLLSTQVGSPPSGSGSGARRVSAGGLGGGDAAGGPGESP